MITSVSFSVKRIRPNNLSFVASATILAEIARRALGG
jgi:hypothetical protein